MDILQVNKYFYTKGGSERYFFSLSEELEERGHRIIPFSMKHPRNYSTQYSDYFVDEVDYGDTFSFRQELRVGATMVRSRQAADHIHRLINDFKPQIAHLHNIYHQITPSIIPVLEAAEIPTVITLHDYKLICPNYRLYNRWGYCFKCKGGAYFWAPLKRCNENSFKRSVLLALEAYWQKFSGVYKGVKRFVSPSRYMRDRFIEAGFDKEKVIYVPPYISEDDVEFDRDPQSQAILKRLPEDYILYFGRLDVEKGLFPLLDAVHMLEGVPLVICGTGPLDEELQEYVRLKGIPNITFTGYLDKDRLMPVIQHARAVVMPSLWPENAPYTVLESAALGVPLIVSDRGGLPEMAEKIGSKVYSSDSPLELSQRIAEVWENREEADRMKVAGLQAIKEHYNRETHLDRIESIYKELIG